MILITKASGQTEQFAPEKIKRSLKKIRTPEAIIQRIIEGLKKAPHIKTTRDVYLYVSDHLRKEHPILASRYHLKNALYEFGPEGFYFEKFIEELFRAQQFETARDQVVKGECVDHELDVVAFKKELHFMVECKFHNAPGIKTDVKVALYIHARFQDIQKTIYHFAEDTGTFTKPWLATNTKFTTDAIEFARCTNMGLIGWAYPADTSIETMVDYYGLYPITCLTSLNHYQKKQLLEAGIILCKQLASLDKPPIALHPQHWAQVREECKALSETK